MMLTIDESFKKLNIPVARHKLAASLVEVESAAKKFKLPVVLKLVSRDVIHKTEAGGVVVADSLAKAKEHARQLLKRGDVLVQEYCEGAEFFLGLKADPTFGHVLLAGMGGIFVEVYNDIAFRVCPITRKDAKEMLQELKGRALLEGVRGQEPVNEKALIDAMVELSKLPKKMPAIQELDINPFFINKKEGKAADARILLRN